MDRVSNAGLLGRRRFIGCAVLALGLGVARFGLAGETMGAAAILPPASAKPLPTEEIGKMEKTDAEWQRLLSAEQFTILRQAGTERPFTSPLLNEHRPGVFACVACDLPLFASTAKYDSGTGWPSFFAALPGHVQTSTDYAIGTPRTEYHCARCGGHHGHVFPDGPKPTGLRYCSNGAVLRFKAHA